MYVEDIIYKLKPSIVRFGNIDYYPVIKIQDELHTLGDECIRWSTDDFKYQAIDACDGDETIWEQYYNKEMFGMALQEMINRHDWETVDYYLETYCKIKDYVTPLEMKDKKK